MGKTITCLSIGSYRDALTRGKMYEVMAENDRNVRVRGDNGRTRWYSLYCFDMEGKPAPTIVRWKFDEEDDAEVLPEITFQLSDGTYRWCILATPFALRNLLEDRDYEPGIHATHLIVMRSLNPRDVGLMLYELDQQGELLEASRPLETGDNYESYYQDAQWYSLDEFRKRTNEQSSTNL